jgi:hypothetical protein
MPRIFRHHRPGTRGHTSPLRRGRGGGRRTSLELTSEQRAFLVAHGFGPDTADVDFRDAAVRARFVAVLESSGALRSGSGAPVETSPPLRRAG